MTRRRFTDQQLFSIRNHIPIRQVIERILRLPAKMDQNIFRFSCPICAEFNTAINLKTNLARCFRCEKNFNPIDIIMIVRQTNFVETVNLLLDYQKKSVPADKTSSEAHVFSHISQPSVANRPPGRLAPIGDLLPEIVEKIKKEYGKTKNEKTGPPVIQPADDISKLEQIVENLSQLIHDLKANR
jgi:hypothetical protein